MTAPGDGTSARRAVAQVLGIYVIARLVGLVILLIVEQQLHGQRFPGGPIFRLWLNVFERWDGIYYRMAATDGYPSVLPYDASGQLLANTWAFFPAFPMTSQVISVLTGLEFTWAALALNFVAGAIAAVCIAKIAWAVGDDDAGWRAAMLWAFFPTAFVLQVPYAEAVYAACASAFLLALITRRHATAAVLLILSSLSRGYALPLSAAAACGVYVAIRRQHVSPGNWRLVMLAGAALVAPVLWIGIAGITTGNWSAYTATQEVWGFRFDAGVSIERWLGAIGTFGRDWYFSAIVLGLAAVVASAVAAWRLRLPLELRAYTVLSALFLLAISQPGSIAFGSIPRFIFGILTLPVVAALIVRRAPALVLVVAVSIALQYCWVLNIWSGRMAVAP